MNTKKNKHNLIAFVAVLALFITMSITLLESSVQENQTIDEGVHIMAGFSYLKTGDFRMNREHPPLIKILAAAPLLLTPATIDTEAEEWKNADQWGMAQHFLYKNTVDADSILLLGRTPIMLLTLLLGALIFLWTKKIFGMTAGLFALTLYTFDPNFIAHGKYITTDIGAALAFALTLYTLARWIKKPTLNRLALFALCFGLAQVTKFSAILLLPLVSIIELIWLLWQKEYRRIPKRFLQIFAAMIIGTLAMVTLAYLPAINHIATNLSTGSLTGEHFGVRLPYFHIYTDGLLEVIGHSAGGHGAYLLGTFSETGGWWNYFPITFLVKTPAPTLVLFLIALVILTLFRRQTSDRLDEEHMNTSIDLLIAVTIPILYMLASMINNINLGWRHLTPIYPFLFLLAGGIVHFGENMTRYEHRTTLFKIFNTYRSHLPQKELLSKNRWKNLWFFTTGGIVILTIISSLAISPFYISYFSEFIGGANNGYKYLLDSNLDWGQAVKGLKKELNSRKIDDPIYVSYFGQGNLEYYGIEQKQWPEKLPENLTDMDGIVAVSISNLLEDKYLKRLQTEPILTRVGYSMYLYDLRKK